MRSKPGFLSLLAWLCLAIVSCARNHVAQSRGYIYDNKKPSQGYGAYAYVLLPSGYSSATDPKYSRMLHTANAFLENFPLPNNVRKMKDKSGLMVTHWMLRSRKPVEQNGAILLEYYDYPTALTMLTAIKMSGRQGPVLVAWKKPFNELGKSEVKQSLIFDLSRFSDQDIDRAFKLWRDIPVGRCK